MHPRRSTPPLWFVCLVHVAGALCVRHFAGMVVGPPADAGGVHQVQLAFWPLVIFLAEAIWTGIQAAGKVALVILTWSVKALWWFATLTYNALKGLGVAFVKGAKEIWEFSRATYDHVLKPAWTTLKRWYHAFRDWYDATIRPVLDFAIAVRDTIICWWKTYVQPWLDIIDVTRRVARVLGALGFEWAKTLDRKLGELEAKIQRPFQLLLSKVNEIVNLVNRVLTADGLFQRLAFISTLARDYQYAWRAIVKPYSKSITDAERPPLPKLPVVTGLSVVVPGIRVYMAGGSGPYADEIRAAAAATRVFLRKR